MYLHKILIYNTLLPILVVSGLANPVLVKLHDFNNTNINSPSAQNPNDSPLLIGNKLWFTSETGGANGFGTLSSYDLSANTTNVHLSLDNATGNTPKATPTRDGDLLYFTTVRGGTGDRGTLSAWNLGTSTHTVLWNSPQSTPATNPNSLWGDVAVIDRGALGKDLYFMTQNGGVGSAYGTILRYQTSDGSVRLIHSFQGTPDGKQPYKGFTVVGTDLYFTTFTGGVTGTGFTQGAGTLGKVDVSVRDSETVMQLAVLPSGDGSERFGVHNPYYRAADHSLYFNTLGTSTQSGALMKFDLTTNTLTTLHEIQGAATTSGPFPEGKLAYGAVVEWNKWLYYTTIQGGNYGGGTINRYHIPTGAHEVLFHLDSDHAVNASNPMDNIGGEPRGGFVFNGSISSPAFYLLTRQGGVYDHGTVLRLDLDAALPPSPYEAWFAGYGAFSGGNSLPTADADGDGRSNRDEFAFGTSPVSGADGGGFSATSTASGLEIRWTARTDGSVTYTVTGSPTLGSAPSPWSAITQAPSVMALADIAVPPGYERRRVVIPIESARGFFRVEAQIPDSSLP